LPDSHRETELKYVLGSAADAAALRRALGPAVEERSQQNFFFDTQDRRLLAAGAALRVRTEKCGTGPTRAWITLKCSESRPTGGLFARDELEREIPHEAAMTAAGDRNLSPLGLIPVAGDVFDAARDLVGPVAPEGLRFLGMFHTWRQVFRPNELGGMELVLDEVGAAEHFEVELELDDPSRLPAAREALEGLLRGATVAFSQGAESKFARMLRLGGITIIDYQ